MRKLACAVLFCWLITLGCSQVARDRFKHWFLEIPGEGDIGSSLETPAAGDVPPASTYVAVRTSLPELAIPGPRFASLHPPFLDRKCRQCHDAAQRMQARDDLLDSCRSCHTRYFSDEVGHPPVEQGQCTECHDMHRSDRDSLLAMPMFDLCVECHEEPEDLSEPAHTVAEVERCTACHDPHFGTEKLLRANPAIAIPQ